MTSSITRNKYRTGYFIEQFGVPSRIHPKTAIGEVSLAVMEFSIPSHDGIAVLATNGMSEISRIAEDGQEVRTELVTLARKEWTGAAIEILDGLARYPVLQDTYFADYDTLLVSSWPTGLLVPFDGFLFLPPINLVINELPGLFQVPISFHQVVPAYASELQLAENGLGEKVFVYLSGLPPYSCCVDNVRAELASLPDMV